MALKKAHSNFVQKNMCPIYLKNIPLENKRNRLENNFVFIKKREELVRFEFIWKYKFEKFLNFSRAA